MSEEQRERGRALLALVALLALAALWRTGVRAGDEPVRRHACEPAPPVVCAEYAEAVEHLTKRLGQVKRRLEEDPRAPELLYRLSSLYWQRAQLRALDAYTADAERAGRLEGGDDRDYHTWMARALARDAGGDLREAARAARVGLSRERDPESRWRLLRALARAECARGHHDLELKALEEAARLRPDDLEVLRRLARTYGEIGDLLAAEVTLERAWQRRRACARDPQPAADPRRPALGEEVLGPDLSLPGDHRWASTAHDGDEWIAGLYIR